MNTLSKQPVLGKQQAARLTRQLQQFAISRRGVAFGAALLLAGGGYAYIQQLQAQQKEARERYVDSRYDHKQNMAPGFRKHRLKWQNPVNTFCRQALLTLALYMQEA